MCDATDALPDLPGAVAEALSRTQAGAPVKRHETHGSWVVVAGDRAVKIKKPVVMPFLDYGTLARRREMCREEVRVNRRLAERLYLGTVGIRRRPGGGVVLDPDDAADGTIEVGVLMRRFREADTLASAVERGEATPSVAHGVGARLAAFHTAHPRPDATEAAVLALRAAVRTSLDDLEADASGLVAPAAVVRLRGRLEAVLSRRAPELRERGERGLVVDGHGDLRAEHVLLPDPLEIVDALEFDPSLRITDAGVDLGFLVMDLQGAGAGALAEALVAGYRAAGGDPGDPALLAAFACYRAVVRAKVDLVRRAQGGQGIDGRVDARIALAQRLAWRALGPIALVVCGPPASGKTTLAAAMAAEGGLEHLSSDVVRKALAGLRPEDRAAPASYGLEATIATYRALGDRARDALDAGCGVVLDATCGSAVARSAMWAGLGPHAVRLLHVECRVPVAVAQERAGRRAIEARHVSDAGPDVARRLAAAFEPLDEVPAARHLVMRADRPVEESLAAVSAWLDTVAVAGDRDRSPA